MANYTGPKNRLSRREGLDLFGKGNKLRRATTPPGQHGPKGGKRLSDYGIQLREKQKTKRIYGIIEKQFRKYFETARKVPGQTGATLLRLLETRLDNVVYRLGFVPTRTMARQIIGHGHILVNGKKVTIPSYQVRPGEKVSLSESILKHHAIKASLENTESYKTPAWVSRQNAIGMVDRLPSREDIDIPVTEQLIVEFYSR